MPTLRRYCRVSKYTVLECRIYLDDPADTSWLLSPRSNILSRIFTSIKPLVLPKLHEEQDRSKTKAKNSKSTVKDVVLEDDFSASLFLTTAGTRHAVITKHKTISRTPAKILSNSNKLTGNLTIRTESPAPTSLPDIPAVLIPDDDAPATRKRRPSPDLHRREKRQKTPTIVIPDEEDTDSPFEDEDKKEKLSMHTSYEGFTIYSRILCLVVKRRRARPLAPAGLMEDWISMSQVLKDGDDE